MDMQSAAVVAAAAATAALLVEIASLCANFLTGSLPE